MQFLAGGLNISNLARSSLSREELLHSCLRPQTLYLLVISHHHHVSRASAESGKIIAKFDKTIELFLRIRSKSKISKIYYS